MSKLKKSIKDKLFWVSITLNIILIIPISIRVYNHITFIPYIEPTQAVQEVVPSSHKESSLEKYTREKTELAPKEIISSTKDNPNGDAILTYIQKNIDNAVNDQDYKVSFAAWGW